VSYHICIIQRTICFNSVIFCFWFIAEVLVWDALTCYRKQKKQPTQKQHSHWNDVKYALWKFFSRMTVAIQYRKWFMLRRHNYCSRSALELEHGPWDSLCFRRISVSRLSFLSSISQCQGSVGKNIQTAEMYNSTKRFLRQCEMHVYASWCLCNISKQSQCRSLHCVLHMWQTLYV